jgi:uncharacterized protein (TIGR03435 family)
MRLRRDLDAVIIRRLQMQNPVPLGRGQRAKVLASVFVRGSGYIMPNELSGTNMDIGALASMLASPAGGPVQDQTGLQGKYTIKVQFAPATDAESTLPSIFTAVKEQLGLELKPARVPVPTLII